MNFEKLNCDNIDFESLINNNNNNNKILKVELTIIIIIITIIRFWKLN